MRATTVIAAVVAAAGFAMLAVVNCSDPGFLPQRGAACSRCDAARGKDKPGGPLDTSEGDDVVSQLDSPALWAGHWGQLCVTCRVVRPLRAKHDAETDRCIAVFDHYCPWVGNAVGKGNRHYFIASVLLLPTLIGCSAALARLQTSAAWTVRPRRAVSFLETGVLWLLGWMLFTLQLLLALAGLAVSQLHQARWLELSA